MFWILNLLTSTPQVFVYYVSLYLFQPIIERWNATKNFEGDFQGTKPAAHRHRRQQILKDKEKSERTYNLIDLASNNIWQELAKLAPLRSGELEQEDARNGRNPLHIACSCDSAGIYVLRTLVEAAPHIASKVDYEGSTPLHCLLQHEYCSPPDEALRLLIDAYPDAIAIRDIYGRTPLFRAIEKNLSLSGLKIIMGYIPKYPEAAENILQCCELTEPTLYQDPRNGRESLDHQSRNLCPSEIDTERTPLYIAWRNTLTPLDGSEYKAKGKLWEKAMLLLKAAYFLKHPDTKFPPLQALLEFLPYLPLDIQDFLYTAEEERCMSARGQSAKLCLDEAMSVKRSYDEQMYLMDQLLKNHLVLKEETPVRAKPQSQKKLDVSRTESSDVSCNRLPEKNLSLLKLASSGHWKELAKFAPSYSAELLDKDANGLIPLHIACRCSSIDMNIVRALLKAAPHTARFVDNEGSTPLHFLLHYCSPKKLKNGGFRFLIDAYPGAIAGRDIYGRAPLFHAVEKNSSLSGLKIIMEYPGAVESILQCCGFPELKMQGKYQDPTNSRGSLVHQSIYPPFSKKYTKRTPLYIAWRNALTPLGVPSSDFRTKGERWEKAMLLLKVAYSHRYPGTSFHPLHALLDFLPYLPSKIYSFLFALAEHDHFMKAIDGKGRLPLHIAASVDIVDNEVVNLVNRLLSLHPEAIRHKTSNGRLPFHEAIAAGKSWIICKRLLNEYPAAMEAVDDVTGVYPFMLAASSFAISSGTEKREYELSTLAHQGHEKHPESNLQFTTIYELILANPKLVELFYCM